MDLHARQKCSGLILAVLGGLSGCAGAEGSSGAWDARENAEASGLGGKADGDGPSFARPETMTGWSEVPVEDETETWVLGAEGVGEVLVRFRREEQSGIRANGASDRSCQSIVAADARIYVREDAGTESVALSARRHEWTRFGSGEAATPIFDGLAFDETWTRPVSGETFLAASVDAFPIATRCSGERRTLSYRFTLTRTLADGTEREATGALIDLSAVLSNDLEAALPDPRPECERQEADVWGADVERCMSAGYEELRISVARSDDPSTASRQRSRELRAGKQHELWIRLNGRTERFPMYCRASGGYPYGSWACTTTLGSAARSGTTIGEGFSVTDLFEGSADAWEIDFVPVSEDGEWANPDGIPFENYRARY
jgi:hypothetical protein